MSIVAAPIADGNAEIRRAEARRKLIRLEVYRRAGRIGRTSTRAYVVSLVSWRLGDIPSDLAPDPVDFGLSERTGHAWAETVEDWIIGATHAFDLAPLGTVAHD